MKPYSLDLRQRVVNAIENGEGSVTKAAQRFAVSKICVERWVRQKRPQGHVVPRRVGQSVA
jgi:transposase